MKQGVLPIQYEQEKSSKGMTSLSGLVTYLELMHAAGLRSSIERHVGLRGGGQGWTDSQGGQLADTAEPGRWRVGVRSGCSGEGRWVLQGTS